jgi:predicted ferric reductase
MVLQVRRRATAQAPFLVVLLLVVAVFVYLTIEPSHWRRATAGLAVAMLLAAVLRVTLAPARAGMLAVRGRWWDTLCYAALGVLILIADIRLKN